MVKLIAQSQDGSGNDLIGQMRQATPTEVAAIAGGVFASGSGTLSAGQSTIDCPSGKFMIVNRSESLPAHQMSAYDQGDGTYKIVSIAFGQSSPDADDGGGFTWIAF